MEYYERLHQCSSSTIRLSIPLIFTALAGLCFPSAPAFSISVSKARCWARRLRRRLRRLSHRLGLGRPRRRHRVLGGVRASCMALPRSPIAATRSSRASPSTSASPGSPSCSARPGSGRAAARRTLPADARFATDHVPPGADAIRDGADHRPSLCRASISGNNILTYLAFLAVPFSWWVLYRTAFRPAPARRRRKSGVRSIRQAFRSPGCATARCHVRRHPLRLRRHLSRHRPIGRPSSTTCRRARAISRSPPWSSPSGGPGPACSAPACSSASSMRMANFMQGKPVPRHRRSAGAGFPGAALYPDLRAARRLHRRGDTAARPPACPMSKER